MKLLDVLTIGTDGKISAETSIWEHYHSFNVFAANPGASGATLVAPDGNTSGGYQLNAVGETLRFNYDIHDDWDQASDINIHVRFECNIDNSGGGVGDTVDLQLLCYLKGFGDVACKLQTLEVATVVGQSPQYKQFEAQFAINFDDGSNPVDVGDFLSVILNLETDTSEVDDIVVNHVELFYNRTKPSTETE